MFSRAHILNVISVIGKISPNLGTFFQNELESYKKSLINPPSEIKVKIIQDSSFFSFIWNIILILIVSYFLISCIHSLAEIELQEREKKEN